MEKMYLIPDSLRQALIEYMATRPYKEVAQGIVALSSLKPAEGDQAAKKED